MMITNGNCERFESDESKANANIHRFERENLIAGIIPWYFSRLWDITSLLIYFPDRKKLEGYTMHLREASYLPSNLNLQHTHKKMQSLTNELHEKHHHQKKG